MSTASQPQLNAENHLSAHEARWFAVYTNYKREKLVAKRLEGKGIEYFLPLQQFTRRYTRKIKQVQLPLINCYIFVKITKAEYVRVLETENVLKFVRFARNLISIPESEINILRRVIGEGIEVEAEPGKFATGDEVEIISGHLTGLRGILMEQRSDKNFVVELENMGFSLKMQFDPALLQRLGPGTAKSDDAQKTGAFNRYL